jgi:hypothetical protein
VRAAVDAWNREDLGTLQQLTDERVQIRSVFARELTGEDAFEGSSGLTAWFESITQSFAFRMDPQYFVDLGRLILVIGHATARARSGGPEVEREWAGVFTTDGTRITFFETHLSHSAALASAARLLDGVATQEPPPESLDLGVG